MKLDQLEDLFHDELKDVYHAEKQLLKALPKMAKAASSPKLKAAFSAHLEQTKTHVQRVEQVFEMIGKPARAKTCKAMKGLVEEGSEMMEEDAEPDVKDAGLIGSAQRVEHYEMAAYGCLRTYANLMGKKDVAKLLQQTLDEEGSTDKKLTMLAEAINVEALD